MQDLILGCHVCVHGAWRRTRRQKPGSGFCSWYRNLVSVVHYLGSTFLWKKTSHFSNWRFTFANGIIIQLIFGKKKKKIGFFFVSNVQLFYFNAQGHLLKLYTQSLYIEVVQGGVSSGARHNWLWIFSLPILTQKKSDLFSKRYIMQLFWADVNNWNIFLPMKTLENHPQK